MYIKMISEIAEKINYNTSTISGLKDKKNLEIWETLSDLTHLLDRLVGEKVQLRLEYDPVKRAVRPINAS